MRARADLGLALALSLGLHGAVLGAMGLLSATPPASGREAQSPEEEVALTVVALDAAAARRYLEPALAPSPARPREATRAPHARAELEHLPRPTRTAPSLVPSSERPSPRPPELLEPRRAAGRVELVDPSRPAPELPRDAPDREAAVPSLAGSTELVLERPPLRYPESARARGVEGLVVVGVEVARDGRVARAWCLRSSGARALDRAALENLRRWRFDPRAVEAAGTGRTFRQGVRFTLE